ncbi:hypothetical protein O3M35_005742 [Rhynocoris fuscipes]|uniref:Pyroglutamyl-peptidase I n=1 Tax=Rhynocoris fuscipes TaxID=488301 RepID=A0AAW1DKK7_9HEMI
MNQNSEKSHCSISKNTIVVTGFGPFGPHKVNDSWECVKRLKETNIEDELGVSLITKELPVVYANSEREVPDMWSKYNPFLMVHIGVHNLDCVKIERIGRKNGYRLPDTCGTCPSSEVCPVGEESLICNTMNLNAIIEKVDSKGLDLSIYLCEYTYYLSLNQDAGRSIFIHIPPATGAPSIEDKTAVIKNIIAATYLHLTSK